MNKFFLFSSWLFSCICTISFVYAELPSPYNEIEVLPRRYFNRWFKNAQELDRLIEEHDVKIIVELGTWLGASAIYMAKQIPPDGKIYCVDHWKGNECLIQSNDPEIKEILSTLYVQFLSNIIHEGLTDKVIPINMTTDEAAKILDVKPDLVYVDAAHDENSVYRDLRNWYRKLAPGGIICGDDWQIQGVRKSVNRYARENGISVHVVNNRCWSFPPKK